MTKKNKETKESIMSKLKSKFTNKKLLRSNRATLQIPEYKPEPYRSIYFKTAYEKEKRLFFS